MDSTFVHFIEGDIICVELLYYYVARVPLYWGGGYGLIYWSISRRHVRRYLLVLKKAQIALEKFLGHWNPYVSITKK